ncbi:MAG: ATP-binding protein [Pirellulaceae bacterium]
MNWTSIGELDLPSEAAAGKRAVDELLRRLQEHEWQENDIFGVHLAVEEALVNAIKHGNQYDDQKKVRFLFKLCKDRVRIEIIDEGEGFDPTEVPDPTDDDNLETPSGRGIMLMRNFMSFVEYNASGNHVVMEKVRENGAAH